MAHTPQDPSSSPGAQLAIRTNTTILMTVDLVTPHQGGWRRNYSLAQAYGNTQAVRTGDGRFVIEERTATVLLTAASGVALADLLFDLDQHLQAANNFLYDGITLELVGSPGVSGVQYLGTTSAQVTITYLPRYGLATATPGTVMGPL